MPFPIPAASDFSLHNLPFGIFSLPGESPCAGIAVGEHVLDLAAFARRNDLGFDPALLERPVLNDFIALGKSITNGARARVRRVLEEWEGDYGLFHRRSEIQLHLPIHVGDYTDFYSSIEHATNVGKLFRDPENALLPNWRHLPVGYHGRASSIVVSGTEVRRPRGQRLPAGAEVPVFGPSERLDFELEVAAVIGKSNPLGEPVPVDAAEDYIFGFVLFNDWSARDIQSWEYRPLGPFLGKSFASTISPWIVPLEALAPFRVPGPAQTPPPLPYLRTRDRAPNFDLELAVDLLPEGAERATTITRTNFRDVYWSVAQQLAHHTSNGCNLRVGDLLASGTVSGNAAGTSGCLLEATRNGREPIRLDDGTERAFLADGDRVTLLGHGERDGVRVGFGTATGRVVPAR